MSRQTNRFIKRQLPWTTVIFLPKRSPNLNPVDKGEQEKEKDVCANHNCGTE
ncbi:MAG TPA: hypothetical protein VEH06_09370 [Candidatus Bathyarchaeia archaeon]|nr:hypothetical protein [Candidatus Bathyarchaeia archaeon]